MLKSDFLVELNSSNCYFDLLNFFNKSEFFPQVKYFKPFYSGCDRNYGSKFCGAEPQPGEHSDVTACDQGDEVADIIGIPSPAAAAADGCERESTAAALDVRPEQAVDSDYRATS